ncbi:MAG: hypothetical protein NTW96_27090 [Planctomycetia bacterium]|nr:hypothetical protein [Planctomycetia bacterium]
MERAFWSTLIWLALLWLCAIGLTIASFYAFVLPENRGLTFGSVIVSSCLAEFALFGYLAYFLTVPHTVARPSPAARMRILFLLVVYTLLVLISGSFAVHSSLRDTFFSDKIILFQSILTFFLLLGAYLLHRQDVVLQIRDDAPQKERVRLQSYSVGLDALVDSLRSLSDRHESQAGELDRLVKRLSTLKSQLLAVSPVAQREPARMVEPLSTADIEQGLLDLHADVGRLTEIDEAQFGGQVVKARGKADELIGLLRRREDVTSF